MLLTDKEIKTLYDASQVIAFKGNAHQQETMSQDFLSKFYSVVNGFGSVEEANFLFGKQKNCSPAELPFTVFFQAIRHHFASFKDEERFLPEAFSPWETSFYDSISSLFATIAVEVLEDLVGKMTTPTQAWMDKTAMPAICNGSHFRSMALKYPIFARQIIEYVHREITHIQEVIDALQNELTQAWHTFFGSKFVPRIMTVEGSTSDRHNGGKSVHIIIFEDGNRIVYKPHNASLNLAFQAWLTWMSETSRERPFLLPRTITTTNGSFYEYIQPSPLEVSADAAEYFRRAGFLMGAVYLLHGNDLHAENIIARGKEPVIVDLETMIAPEGCLLYRIAGGKSSYSVNSMAMLPFMLALPGFREAKYAGLYHSMPGTANLPIFEGKPISGKEYSREISDGFDKAIRVIMLHKEAAEELLMKDFDGCKMRMVIRPTYFYVRLLIGLCSKGAQHDIKQYKALIARKLFQTNKYLTKTECANLLLEEEEALDRLDVPFFEETLDQHLLHHIKQSWDRIDETLLRQEKSRISFSLAEIRPNACADEITDTISITINDKGNIEENLHEQAESLIKLLDTSGHSAVITREQQHYLLSDIPMAAISLLDGNLGTLIALGAYRTITNENSKLDRLITESVKKLMDPVRSASALTARELGIADGTAGYVIGCKILYKMNLLSAEYFTKALEFVGRIANDELGLRYGETDLLYGNVGMLYSLSKVPVEFYTPQLHKLHDLILKSATSEQTYRNRSELEIITKVESNMFHIEKNITPKSLVPTGNNSLRFGNSGQLYYATEYLLHNNDSAIRSSAELLCKYLSAQQHIVPKAAIPDCCTEIGLFHGMPGVLYSICRFLRPDLIPEL